MIQTQQSLLITAHFNKKNTGLWQSSFIKSVCYKIFSQKFSADKEQREKRGRDKNRARQVGIVYDEFGFVIFYTI